MKIDVSFKETNSDLDICFLEETVNIEVAFSERQVIITSTVEPYEGAYTVSPTFETQTLDTAGKRMTDDLTIEEIKVSSVSNPFGGRTVYIGG